jgi:hypothetical protein
MHSVCMRLRNIIARFGRRRMWRKGLKVRLRHVCNGRPCSVQASWTRWHEADSWFKSWSVGGGGAVGRASEMGPHLCAFRCAVSAGPRVCVGSWTRGPLTAGPGTCGRFPWRATFRFGQEVRTPPCRRLLWSPPAIGPRHKKSLIEWQLRTIHCQAGMQQYTELSRWSGHSLRNSILTSINITKMGIRRSSDGCRSKASSTHQSLTIKTPLTPVSLISWCVDGARP